MKVVIDELEKALNFEETHKDSLQISLEDIRLATQNFNCIIGRGKALEFQEDIEIWEAKLPGDYKNIIQMSKTPEIYYNLSKKDLYDMFSNGILLQGGNMCLSVGTSGQRNEMISATTFSYENNKLHKRRSIQKSRFQRVLRIIDISNLKTQIKIKTQFLSPNVVYGAYLIFKFCDSRKFSNQPMYVNLKYKLGSETLHAYFARWGDDKWLMIELCRLLPCKKDVDFEVVLESMSRYYCGSGAIYVEGIHFQSITNATLKAKHEVYEKLKGVPRVYNSNSDSVQQVPVDYDGETQQEYDEKVLYFEKTVRVYENLSVMMYLLPLLMNNYSH
ncbi:hypothetical protein L1987_61057 [Smallanthus sonchifolius]|uniref:Uncharacterized protein n=1 Tax=Smallanthus sonchifolius TaxID=185202 RepID=A0ACB9DA54_9ASTR|nr:hypothetical protein L1987_61057 [Smallanthus sonchifolius]